MAWVSKALRAYASRAAVNVTAGGFSINSNISNPLIWGVFRAVLKPKASPNQT